MKEKVLHCFSLYRIKKKKKVKFCSILLEHNFIEINRDMLPHSRYHFQGESDSTAFML